MDIIQRLKQHAAVQPDVVAFTFLRDGERETDRLTFRELERRTARVAKCLRADVEPGDRVLLLLPQDLRFIVGFLGILRSGAVPVPLLVPRPKRSVENLQSIVTDCKPTTALSTREIGNHLHSALVVKEAGIGWRWLEDIENAVSPCGELPERFSDLAFLQYTSGSSGSPKGVEISHANLVSNIRTISEAFAISDKTIAGGWLPTYHDMGLIGLILSPLYLGVRSVLMPPLAFLQKPERWLRLISKYGVTVSGGPNFAYGLCVDRIPPDRRADLNLSSWRVAFNGGEPVRFSTVDRFCRAFGSHGFRPEAMTPAYGLAEATLFVAGGIRRDGVAVAEFDASESTNRGVFRSSGSGKNVRLIGCKKIESAATVCIVDPTSRRSVSPGDVGEIWLAGESVARGYFGRYAGDFHAYIAESGEGPFLRTGDLGVVRDDVLFVVGRIKDLIIVRGRNYYPQDLEETVESCSEHIARGAGVAFSVEVEGDEKIVLVHELKRTSLAANHAEIVTDVRRAITGKHGINAYGIVLAEPGTVPKTSSGKLKRAACRLLFERSELSPVYSYFESAVRPSIGKRIGTGVER